MHIHHKIPKSRGGTDDEWNLVEVSDYEHAYEHALDFVLFDHAPRFDFRHRAWKQLPEELRKAVLKKASQHTGQINKARKGQKRSAKSVAKQRETIARTRHLWKPRGLGFKRGPYKPITCPHCGKSGSPGAMTRWHFNNCKQKP